MALGCVHQPLKGLYLTYQLISTLFIRVPMWSLWYLLPSMRPVPTWSWGHTMLVECVRHVLHILSVTDSILPNPDYRAIVPTKEAEGVWVDAAPSELIRDELKTWASVAGVAPARIPGYWYCRSGLPFKPAESPKPGEKVFFYLHGGGYTQLSAHPKAPPAGVVRGLIALDPSAPRAFALEFRVSSTHPLPDLFPFPAALLDAFSGYHYLVEEIGYQPSDIILAGDSAGGNLALALCRYLVEHADLPAVNFPAAPGNLLLLSPWVDLSDSHELPGSSYLTFNMDILNSGHAAYSRAAFLRPFGSDFALLNRYVSPASLHPSVQAHFRGFPRTFIAVGGVEKLFDQIRTLRDKMVLDMGKGDVTFFEAPDAIHDYVCFDWHPQRMPTLKAIATWLSEAP